MMESDVPIPVPNIVNGLYIRGGTTTWDGLFLPTPGRVFLFCFPFGTMSLIFLWIQF